MRQMQKTSHAILDRIAALEYLKALTAETSA